MQAVAGGAISKQAYLLAQLWLDFLNANPERKFLQVAHSEGAVHLDAALRLIVQAGATSLLDRIRILTFCPAHFIHPSTYPGNLQVANFVKEEDRAINPWGTKASSVSQRGHIRIVAHQVRADDGYNNPHDFKSWDFVDASRAEINAFFRTGNIEE
jgi:hypothetical protein